MNGEFRYEVKFVLNEREFTHALSWLNAVGAKKRFLDRTVNSLYFDNIAQEAVQHNLSGIAQRHKVRLRWYGDHFTSNSKPKLEIKLRDGRLGSKLEYPISTPIEAFRTQKLSKISREIFNEVRSSNFTHYSINDYLVSMLLVKYRREYYETSRGVRFTIDKQIRFFDAIQNSRIDSLKPINYSPYLVEVKFPKDFKNSVANLLRQSRLTPKRHSKYLAGLAKLGNVSYVYFSSSWWSRNGQSFSSTFENIFLLSLEVLFRKIPPGRNYRFPSDLCH